MSARNLPGVTVFPAHKADNSAISEPIVQKMWDPQRLTALWASTACYRDGFTFYWHLRGTNVYFEIKLVTQQKIKRHIVMSVELHQ
jgi:hypothetical protein